MALTRKDFEARVCACCGGKNHAMVVRPACHPNVGVWVAYDSRSGTLKIACSVCGKFVCDIAVADGVHIETSGVADA